MQMIFLGAALVACPMAYLGTLAWMRAKRVPSIPVGALFMIFGTIGGWLLAIALSPSGLAAGCVIFLITVAPVGLFFGAARIAYMKERGIYHHVTVAVCLLYPLVLVGFVVCGVLMAGDRWS